MMQQNKSDDYVIGTGQNHSVKDFVKLAFKYAGISNWEDYVVSDARYKRPAEVPDLKAKADKAKKVLGWQPKLSFEALVKMMVEADLKRYEKK